MKKNATNKLAFNKAAVTELNANSLATINGGSTIIGGETCSGCVCDPVTVKITVLAAN